jgi:hypothetical protein
MSMGFGAIDCSNFREEGVKSAESCAMRGDVGKPVGEPPSWLSDGVCIAMFGVASRSIWLSRCSNLQLPCTAFVLDMHLHATTLNGVERCMYRIYAMCVASATDANESSKDITDSNYESVNKPSTLDNQPHLCTNSDSHCDWQCHACASTRSFLEIEVISFHKIVISVGLPMFCLLPGFGFF